MKYFIACLFACGVFTIALGNSTPNQEKIKESIERIKHAHEKCNEDPATQVDLEAAKQARHGNGPEPSNNGAHMVCVAKIVGWLNEDGSLNKPLIEERVKSMMGDDPEHVQKMKTCLEGEGTTEDLAKRLMVCYRKNLPHPPNGTHQHDH